MWNSSVFDNSAPIIMNGTNGVFGHENSAYVPIHAMESFPPMLPQIQNVMIQPQQIEMMMPIQPVVQLFHQPMIQIQAHRNFSPPPQSPQLLRSPTERKTPERATSERTVERSQAPASPQLTPVPPQMTPERERIPVYVEVPVEKIVEKRVPVEVEKIVIKEVMVPVEKIVKKVVEKENVIEVPIEVPVEVEVEKIVHKNRTILEDRLVYQDRTVEVEVERVVTNQTYVTHEEFSPPRVVEAGAHASRKASYHGALSPITATHRASSPGLYVSNQPRTYRTGSPPLSPTLTSFQDRN